MTFGDPLSLAASGSTGTKNAASVTEYVDLGMPFDGLAVQYITEAVGATPQITFKVVASHDKTHWYDMLYLTDSTDTGSQAAITINPTAAGDKRILFLSNPVARQFRYWALVVSANTNTTYKADVYTYY